MSTAPKYIELVDKENTNKGALIPKKDKNSNEETPIKKTVLGETSQPTFGVEDTSSPEDSRLLKRKREMQYKSSLGFTLNLHVC